MAFDSIFQPTGESTTVPAPIGGLNTRDAVDMMPEQDAIRLDNFFPGSTDVSLRSGYTDHVTGLPSTIQSLMPYSSGATNKLFAASGSNIYDVTSSGSVGSAVVTSLSNAQFQHVNFTISGGGYLFIVNGADAPRHYNGSAWATPTLSGVTGTTINNVTVFKERLFFCINNSLSFGYLPINSVAGTVATFNLGSIFNMGGYIQAIGQWTRDGGSGPDDYIVFITNHGEAAIYSGSDPSDAAKWSIVGTFKLPRPIGKRCFINVNSDLVLISEQGFMPLSQTLVTGENAPAVAISDKISGSINTAVNSYKSIFGWEAVLYPRGQYGLFNVPTSSVGDFEQYVVNLTTGAWARFTGQNAYCWATLNGDLYFGGNTKVHQADNGQNDGGSAIQGDAKTAFIYYGGRGSPKRFTCIRPVMGSNADLPVSIGFDVDFNDGTNVYTPSSATTTGSEWDTATWDTAVWGGTIQTQKVWRSIADIGWNAAIRIRTSTTAQSIKWHATDVMYERGRGL